MKSLYWVLLSMLTVIVISAIEGYGFATIRRTAFQKQSQFDKNDNLSLNCSVKASETSPETAVDGLTCDIAEVTDVRNEEKDVLHKSSEIPMSEMELTVDESLLLLSQSNEDIVKAGWKLVHDNDLYTLFKRRGGDGRGAVVYMMKGFVSDVSPRLFLHAQTNKSIRKAWDKTMQDMETDESNPLSLDKYVIEGNDDSEDTLYYRTKWPWPLKDRDYTLARRVRFRMEKDKEAIIFVSKATENGPSVPLKDGAIRVDNYWCRSAYFATPLSSSVSGHGEYSVLRSRHSTEVSRSQPRGEQQQIHQSKVSSPREHQQSGAREGVHLGIDKLFSRPMFNLQQSMPKLETIRVKIHKLGKAGDGGVMKIEPASKSAIDTPGTRFVTIFCDDSKVPLPARVVDMISTQAEKVVPDSMRSLHAAALVEQKRVKSV